MSFFKSINNAFVKCFDLKTRANRAEFWYFYLFTTAVGFVGLQLDIFFQLQLIGIQLANSSDSIMLGPMYIFLYFLFIVPSFALYVRRLHDVNRSGWWLLIVLVPFIGIITIIFFMCLKGSEGSNDFGEISS